MIYELRLRGIGNEPKLPRQEVAELGLGPRRLALVDNYIIILPSRHFIDKPNHKLQL